MMPEVCEVVQKTRSLLAPKVNADRRSLVGFSPSQLKSFALVCFWGVFVAGEQAGYGQSSIVFHNTGGGVPIISEVRSVTVAPGLQQPVLVFHFGFATDEIPSPESFLDSFTVTLQTTNQTFSAVYFTADASGVAWAPSTPGGVFIDSTSIFRSPLSYPNLQPVLANRSAFSVTAPIPPEFVGDTVNVFFDLFDNLDNTASQAWFSDLGVVSVPEPGVESLLALGGTLVWVLKRRRK